jgi:uncharacterized protein
MTTPTASYRPPLWYRGRHWQTILPGWVPCPIVRYERERWETPDGDFIDVDWAGRRNAKRLLVLFHGVEGNSGAHYARRLGAAALRRGWRFAVPHFRGCSGEPNRLPRGYHAGDDAEIDWILRRFADRHPYEVHAAGVSLGGNALLKWLGTPGHRANEVVRRAAAVSATFDLVVTGGALARGFNLVYARQFLANDLRWKAQSRLSRFPGLYDRHRVKAARTLHEFDDAVTAPLHGFRDGLDYWTRASARPVLPEIRVPTLMLNAKNDPFLPAFVLQRVEDLRDERRLPAGLEVDFPDSGGHCGFLGNDRWFERRVLGFLDG